MQTTLDRPAPTKATALAAGAKGRSALIAELRKLEKENQELREILANLENKGAKPWTR